MFGETVWVDFEHPDKAEAALIARTLRKRGYKAESHHFRVSIFLPDARPERLHAAMQAASAVDELLESLGEWRPKWATVHA